MAKTAVIEDHAPAQQVFLAARKGDLLRVEREDDEWPGWVWCVDEAGVGSWVPDPYLARDGERARLLVDYDATELTVCAGDVLALQHEVNGWWWATAVSGAQGWVPAAKLEHI
jgi:hypothetical protein